jgi:ribosome-associated protein
MIHIKNNIFIDENSLTFQATRSSGPGGQHVNKVSSKVILSCPLNALTGLSEHQKEMIKIGLRSYIVSGDIIKIESQKQRSQFSNKQDCIDKLVAHLQNALKKKKKRKKTTVPKSVKEKRLQEKSKRAKLKRDRKALDD